MNVGDIDRPFVVSMITAQRRNLTFPGIRVLSDKKLFNTHKTTDGAVEYAIASGNEALICHQSGTLKKRFIVDFQIKQVLWVSFRPGKDDRASDELLQYFAVVGEQEIVFYLCENNQSYHFYIPFKTRHVYATDVCLIVERHWANDADFRTNQADRIFLYSLAHPLEELLPLIYRLKDAICQWLFCWERDEITVVQGVGECILVYDRVNECHRLYRIRRSAENELRSCVRLHQRRTERNHSTPNALVHTPKGLTPRGITEGLFLPPLAVRTRSMMRLARTRTFPMDSPALSAIGTPLSNISGDAESLLSFRLRGVSHYSNSGLHLTRALDREPEEDLFYAEFCLECVWMEPSRKDADSASADKAFLSKSHTRQTFLNLVSHSQEQLRCIRLTEVNGSLTTSGQLISIPVQDADVVKKDGLTIVLEQINSLALYSGSVRSTVIVLVSLPIQPAVRLLPSVDDTFMVWENGSLSTVELPSAYSETLVERFFYILLDALPQEKAVRLASDWRGNVGCSIRYQSSTSNPQLHMALWFILKQCGFKVLNHPKLPIQIRNDDHEVEDSLLRMESPNKQRRPLSDREQNWMKVLTMNAKNPQDLPDDLRSPLTIIVDKSAPLFPNVYTVFAVLHSMFEEMLLDRLLHTTRADIVYYLHAFARAINLPEYVKYYIDEVPDCDLLNIEISRETADILPAPHGIKNFIVEQPFTTFDTVLMLMRRSTKCSMHTYSHRTARIIFGFAVGAGCVNGLVEIHRLLGKNWSRKLHVSHSTQEALLEMVIDKSKSSAERCASIFGKLGISSAELQVLPASLGLMLGQILIGNHSAIETLFSKQTNTEMKFPSTIENSRICKLRWPTDIRSENAETMLDSTRPVLINTHELAQHDIDTREAQESFLHCTCIRYLAQAMGRAMNEFRAISAYPGGTLLVPELCLNARLFPANISYEIPITDQIRPYRDWGEFYNGVAGALRLGKAGDVKVDSEWMLAHCSPNDPTAAAGLLYGFGLNGHIVNANMFHIHEILAALDELQSVAVLLGYAIAKMGSADKQVHKMLTTQLPFLMGPTLLPISIPSLIQTAAVAAVGLLFAQTGHLNLAKKLLNEIGKSPAADEPPPNDRVAYRLNAGCSIGLICLGLGTEMLESEPPFKQPQPSVIQRLLTLLNGGPRSMCVFPTHPSAIELAVSPPVTSTTPPSCHVREGDNVNVHLTGHPACIALGLMFLRTNNETIGNHLALPQTITLIEGMRPDLIMMRTLCRNIVMWDSMVPSVDWVEQQVPSVVMDYMRATLKWHDDDDILVVEEEDSFWNEVVDRETIAQVYLYTISGACFALALKHMSGGEKDRQHVFDVIETFANILLPDNNRRTHNRVSEFAGPHVVSLCFNSLLTSLSMVMASTGDMKCLRLARLWRMNEPLGLWMHGTRKHQEQMVAHQSIGMLFMGHGRYAFKDDNLSLAMLIIAFYPVVCHNVTDNRYYHQPLRFLWTQATEQRLIVPCSARYSERPIDCPVKIILKGQDDPEISKGPTLLPALRLIESVEVGGGKYEMARFDVASESGRKELEAILTRRHGRLALGVNSMGALLEDAVAVNMEFSLEDIYSNKMKINDEDAQWNDKCTLGNPLNSPDDLCNLSWPSIVSIPSMQQHLTTIQLALSRGSVIPPGASGDVRLAQSVAEWAGQRELAATIELELHRKRYPNVEF